MENKLQGYSFKSISPSDSIIYNYSGFIYVMGTEGTVRFLTEKDDDITLTFEKKELIPLRVKKIFATGTTATGIYLIC